MEMGYSSNGDLSKRFIGNFNSIPREKTSHAGLNTFLI